MENRHFYITTLAQFNNVYPIFRDSAKLKNNFYHIGLDIEYIGRKCYPESFEKLRGYMSNPNANNAVCVIQMSSFSMTLVINIAKFKGVLPSALTKMLRSRMWIKTGVGLINDINILNDNFRIGECLSVFDVSTLASAAGLKKTNLSEMYRLVEDPHHEDVQCKSSLDWSKNLTDKMIEYCVKDSIMSHRIGIPLVKCYSLDTIFSVNFDEIDESPEPINYVGIVNEYCQKNSIPYPVYEFSKQDSNFICSTYFININYISNNTKNNNKKEAKRDVAKQIVEQMNLLSSI